MRKALLLAVALLLVAPAAARSDVTSVPVSGDTLDLAYGSHYGTDFALVPGGLAVTSSDSGSATVTKVDAATGARTQIASVPVGAGDDFTFLTDADGLGATSGSSVFASEAGGPVATFHSCGVDDDQAPPIALDGASLAYGAQANCANDGAPAFDLTVHDLAAGTDTVLARSLAFDLVGVRYPYVAVSYDNGQSGGKLRVYDLRTQAVITDVDMGESGAQSVDVNASGRVVACTYREVAVWAALGDGAVHTTKIKCDHAQELDGDRISATVHKRATLFDLMTGAAQPLVYGRTRYPSFGTDGDRVAWADTTCRSYTANVASLDDLIAKPATAHFPHCPGRVGKVVTLKGKTASFELTCTNGCTGEAELDPVSGDDSEKDLARAPVDPKPGKPTLVKLKLSSKNLAKLKHATKVSAVVIPHFTTSGYGGVRRLVRG